MTFKIIFICTGNRARSAVAEALLRSMTSSLPVDVSSAGLLKLDAGPALPEAVEACTRIGIDLSAHRSRPFSQVELRKADLIVGFERQHVATAVVDGGAQPERTFLLAELVRLLEPLASATPPSSDPIGRARQLIEGAHDQRIRDISFTAGEEIADPFGQPTAVFDQMTVELYDFVRKICMLLFSLAIPPASVQFPQFRSSYTRSPQRIRPRKVFGRRR